MKRGFLKTAKAAKSTQKQFTDTPTQDSEATSETIEWKLPYGKIEKQELPANYVPNKIVHKEYDSNTMDYDPETTLYTTLPSVHIDPMLAKLEFPDGWTECLFLGPRAKQIVLSTPGFPQPVPIPDRVSYSIGPSSTADLGMVATRNLKMGDLVYAERPLLMSVRNSRFPAGIPWDATPAQAIQASLYERELLLKVAFDRMLPEKRAAYLALANSHTEDGSGPILGVLRTNSFGVDLTGPDEPDLPAEEAVAVVCDVLSRVNHSCAPNAVVHFDVKTFSSQLRVVRDVKKGEEIFVSYCSIYHKLADRREKLAPYGFVCACSRCVDPNADQVCRDIIQSAINLPVSLQRVGVDAATRALESSLKWIAVIEAEGLQEMKAYGDHLSLVMRASMPAMKPLNIIKYGKMRSAWNNAVLGDPNVLTMFT